MAVAQQRTLSNFLLKTPRWWASIRHVTTFLQSREQIHSPWRVIGLERRLGVVPLRQASEPPSGSSYRIIYPKPYTQALDAKYVVSASIPPHLHAGIVLDQLRQRHLRPLTHLTPSQVFQIMGWKTPDVLFRIPVVSLATLRAELSDTSRTSPYPDLIEYPMVSLLNDEHLSILANFYNRLLSGCKVDTLHFGDFTLLPKKRPHGVVANGRPLSDLSVIWKLFSMDLANGQQLHFWYENGHATLYLFCRRAPHHF